MNNNNYLFDIRTPDEKNADELLAKTRARSTDPDTSREAAAHVVKTTLKPSQARVFAALQRVGPCTQKELEGAGLRYSPSRVRTAVSELVSMGRVRDTGERMRLPSGRKAIIWEAAP